MSLFSTSLRTQGTLGTLTDGSLFLSTLDLRAQSLSRYPPFVGLRSFLGLRKGLGSRHPTSALPPKRSLGLVYLHRAENQLSPGLVSLSLLSTPHPRILPHSPVRSSIERLSTSTWRWKACLASGRTPPYTQKRKGEPFSHTLKRKSFL